jgi:CHRD domain
VTAENRWKPGASVGKRCFGRQRPIPAAVALLVAAGLSASAATGSEPVSGARFRAVLNTRKEIPKPTHVRASATGRFSATLSGTELTWTLTFSDLTGPAAAAYLHYGDTSQTGAVLVVICTECMSPSHGRRKLTSAEIKYMNGGDVYVNVDTLKNPRGEIRGQVG